MFDIQIFSCISSTIKKKILFNSLVFFFENLEGIVVPNVSPVEEMRSALLLPYHGCNGRCKIGRAPSKSFRQKKLISVTRGKQSK